MKRFLSLCLVALACDSAHANDYDNLIRAFKYVDAEKLADAKLATHPNDAEALIAKAQMLLSYQKSQRNDEALKYAEQCVSHHPNNSDCHEMLGNVYGSKAMASNMLSAMSYVGKIKDSFQKAIELNPKNLSARHSLMQFYLKAPSFVGGGKAKGQTLIDETKKQLPLIAQLLQVSFNLAQDSLAEAEQLVLTIKPDEDFDNKNFHANLIYTIAGTYFTKKDYARAQKLYQDLQTQYPTRYFGSYGLGRIAFEQGKHKEALSLFEKAYALDPFPAVQFRIGQSYQELGDKANAIRWYERSLQNRPYLSEKLRQDAQDSLKLLKLQS